MKRPRDWTAGPIAVALTAALVAVGALWLSYDRWPRGTAHAALWAVLTAACVWRANRNLRAELDAARRLLDAWNSSEARDELALSPPAGTPTVLYDREAEGDWIDITDNVAKVEIAPGHIHHVGAGPGDVGHLTVPEGATGWLGPDDITFERPAEPVAERVQAIIAHHLPSATPMTVAEADRLIGQLQALPGTDDLGQVCAAITHCTGDAEIRCGKPAAGAIGEAYLDPDGTEMTEATWLCEQHYIAAMSEEDGRG